MHPRERAGRQTAERKDNLIEKDNGGNQLQKRLRIGGVALAVLLVGGFLYWLFFMRNRVSTDDAYVRADSARISSRIPGTVLKVFVENDNWVSKGDTLVALDSRDYEVAVAASEASLREIEAKIRASELLISLVDKQTESQVKSARAVFEGAKDKEREVGHKLQELGKKRLSVLADYKHAKRDYSRFENLYKGGASSERQRDRARTAYKKARAMLAAINADIAALKASRDGVSEAIKQAEAKLSAALSERTKVEIQKSKLKELKAKRDELRAKMKAARLNLSYCTIKAPLSGYVSQKSIQVGEKVQPGMPLMAIVPLKDVYVEANFKETQLKNVRIGQPARIEADIYPGYEYRGRVAGIRAGTGAAFALLPPENATGNWIKVVQRVPVKIRLDSPPPSDHPLRVGLSLEVTIDTSNRTGPLLSPQTSTP